MQSKKLLAKGRTYGELTLEQHLNDTETAVLAIFKHRILKNWCRFFKVKNEEKFLKHLQIAALFHDIGKANAEFDMLVQGQKKFKQTLRHEWISALILHVPNVRKWLEPSGLDLEVITAAVLCHHLQASPKKTGFVDAFGKPRTLVKEVQLYLDNSQVQKIFKKIGEIAQLNGYLDLPNTWISGDKFWELVYINVIDTADNLDCELEDEPDRRSLLLAVKAGLINADSVASAIFRVQSSEAIAQWVNNTLHQEPITPDEIESKILQPRYEQIEKNTGNPFNLKYFQEKATDLNSRLLLLSGCGTGKTIFAYKWQQGVLKHQEAGHIIFLYPTRGTATEGFKDYVSWSPESEASLLTGTAAYELKDMLENPIESTQHKDFTTDERLYALGFWGKRFFSATVDQFLSFLTHSYTGIGLLPVLADSVVVIDEVHSFSNAMFHNLVSFLEHFDIPVLCMTATLPPSRKKQLVKKGLAIFPTEDRSELKELEEAENRLRYIIHSSDYKTTYSQAIAYFNDKEPKRILWVVNTVDRCRQIANDLEELLNTEILTYHSRFTLEDRKERHKETVKAFQGNKHRVIAVTTQVCEMSLDLDADVLITELAPISSLVQRFGRSNRHGWIDYAQIWVYDPPETLPYQKEELENARLFLTEILGKTSQKQLAEKLEKYALKERDADGRSYFIDGGYWATSQPFRDTEDYSVNAVLDEDLETFLKLQEAKNPNLEGLILPVPKKYADFNSETRPTTLPKYLAIASSKLYSKKRGFGECKAKKS